jgi:hypothetical protein
MPAFEEQMQLYRYRVDSLSVAGYVQDYLKILQ